MDNFKKVIRLGRGDDGSVFCSIKYTDGRLSISGVEGPKRNGDCRGSCGQIIMGSIEIKDYAPGWDEAKLTKFSEIWDTWHLNDMQAGSPAQTAYLRSFSEDAWRAEHSSHYAWALEELKSAGLQPDESYEHNGKPYSYGSAWLKVSAPTEALEWLKNLPDTDVTPAWV